MAWTLCLPGGWGIGISDLGGASYFPYLPSEASCSLLNHQWPPATPNQIRSWELTFWLLWVTHWARKQARTFVLSSPSSPNQAKACLRPRTRGREQTPLKLEHGWHFCNMSVVWRRQTAAPQEQIKQAGLQPAHA